MKWLKILHCIIILFFTARTVNQTAFLELTYYSTLPTVTITAPVVDWEEVEICARLVSAEAGNQSYKGQLAVLDVVYNRLQNKSKYKSYKDVIFRPGMFDGIGTKHWYNPQPEHYEIAKDKIIYNKSVLSSDYEYFHNPITSTDQRWIKLVEKNGYIDIGEHRFCKKFEQ